VTPILINQVLGFDRVNDLLKNGGKSGPRKQVSSTKAKVSYDIQHVLRRQYVCKYIDKSTESAKVGLLKSELCHLFF
jgi:hypothetical protein